MKKNFTRIALTLIMGLFVFTANAATGWYEDYIKINVNGAGLTGPTGYYWIETNPGWATSFVNGLGTVTSLKLDGADMKYWSDTQDRTGGSFFYQVTSVDGSTTYIAATESVWTQTYLGGNNYQGMSSGLNVDLLAGIPAGTACKLTIWAKSWGSGQGDSWLSNGGANYTATFTTASLLLTGATGINNTRYTTLKGAFDAINANTSGLNTDDIAIKVGDNTTETATAVLNPSKGISTISTTAGSGYLAPVITLTGGTTTGNGNLVTTITNGSITSIVMTGGTWTAAPTIGIAAPAGGGTTATATGAITSSQVVFTITNPGTGYGPSATISNGGGSGASLDVKIVTGSTAVTGAASPRTATPATVGLTCSVSSAGSGYTSNPGVALNAPFAGGSGSSVTVTGLTASAEFNSLTIYPTASGKTISGGAIGLISIVGRKNVTIDGRVDATGTPTVGQSSNLTLSTTDTGNPLILFNGNSQSNTVKYCTIKGSNTGSTKGGVIQFGALAGGSNGNGLNIIDHNLITNNGTIPQYTIYSIGNTFAPNAGNQITNNWFKDVIAYYAASNTIYIAGGYGTPQNDNFTISGNSFYTTATINSNNNSTRQIIAIGASATAYGGSHTIIGNIIGGNDATGNGTLTKTGTNCTINGILIYPSSSVTAGGVTTTNIQKNVIKNISWTNSGFGNNCIMLSIAGGTGAVNIGGSNDTGNSIGDNESTGSIVITQSTSTASTIGINIATTGNVDCQYNKIGSITTSNVTTGFASTTYAIQKTSTAGTTTISNNTIGSTGTPNSINALTATVAQNVYGINFLGTGAYTISNNTIANLTNGTSTGTLAGIQMNGAGSTGTVSGNTVFSLTLSNASTTAGINGIYSAAGTNTFNGNFVHSFSATTTGSLWGIINNASILTATNNIVKIGDNCTGGNIAGLQENSGALGSTFYHNTVYIGGAPTTGSTATAALTSNVSTTTTTRIYKNNILYNGRVNNGATGKNYGIKLGVSATTNLDMDYNDIYVTDPTYGKIANYVTDIATLTSPNFITGVDVHDVSSDPAFANTAGTTAASFVPSSLLLAGVNASLATDYSGVSRTATPTMGAHDFRIWNGSAWNTAPTADFNARLDANYSGVGFAARNLVLSAGKQLDITSATLAVGNNFTILSDAANGTGTFTNSGSLTVGGTTTVQQYITSSQTGANGRNWYISSPLSAALSSTITTATGNGLVYYDGTTNWPAAGTTMEVMKGYIAKSPAQNTTINFTGGTLNTGDKSVSDLPLGFNLVGNPYPSYVDFAQATKTNVANSIWYRSKSTGSYIFQTYNVPGNIGANDGSAIIPPMQSFWIKTTNATNTFGFTNAMRSHQDQSVAGNRLKAPGANVHKLVRLQLSNPSGLDEMVVYFNPAAQNLLDEYDTQKMFNTVAAQPEVYSTTGSDKLVINGLSEVADNMEIPLGFTTGSAGSFTFKASELTNFDSNTNVYLLDKQENIQTELSPLAEYTFNSDVTTANESRFSLLFKVSKVTTATNDQTNVNTKVLVNEANQLVIVAPARSTYAVYNAAGQMFTTGITASDRSNSGTVYQKGVYIVKITENGKEFTNRVIIK